MEGHKRCKLQRKRTSAIGPWRRQQNVCCREGSDLRQLDTVRPPSCAHLYRSPQGGCKHLHTLSGPVLPGMKRARLVVDEAAARLLAQIAPDLRDVTAERLARHDFGRARTRQLDVDDAL